MEMESRRVVPGCSNAGNPFHECTDACYDRLSSKDVNKKERTFFGFGMRTPTRETPSSTPARGSRSPLASLFTKKKVESETSSPSTDPTNNNFFSRLSPLQARKNEPANNVDSLLVSPSWAVYSGGDYFARRTDQRGDEDDDMSPRPFGGRPKTPEHPLRTPQHRPRTPQHHSDSRPWVHQEDPTPQHYSDPRPWVHQDDPRPWVHQNDPRPWVHQDDPSSLETWLRTPERQSNTSYTRPKTPIHESAATGRRPQTPETRPRTPERPYDNRPRTPIHESAATGRRSQTPETRPRTPERPYDNRPRTPVHESAATGRRPQTPETRPRTPERSSDTSNTRPKTPIHESAATGRRPQTPETRPKTPENQSNISDTRSRTPIHESSATGRRPQTPETRPKTPEHQSNTSDTRSRTSIHESAATGRRPQTPETRPRTPIHESVATGRRPQTPETRPRTPIHESTATGRRPQTPETRPRTEQHRGRSPDIMARSPGPRSKTPEPQPTYFEPMSKTPKPRSKTPEPSPRIPQTQPISHKSLDSTVMAQTVEKRSRKHESRPKTTHSSDHREKISQTQQSQAYNYLGSKVESVYIDDDDESVLLFPELLLSPQEKPHSRHITPNRNGYETPTKQEKHFDQMDDSASTDDDKFSFVDEQEDSSALFYSEISSKSGSSTSVHQRSKQEEQDKANNEPPELPDESQSFSQSEILGMKGIIVKKTESRDEIQSILSESQVSVGDYKVRASVSTTLQNILEKYGDIASTSKLQSLATRSYYLEMLASVVLELQTTPLKHLKQTRVEEMLAIVKDVESVKIKADWLKPVLEEIVEAVKHYDEHKKSITEKDMWERDVLLAREEMEKQLKELRKKEKKMKECREGVTEMASKLGTLDMTRTGLEKSLVFLSSKVDRFQGQSVLQDIL